MTYSLLLAHPASRTLAVATASYSLAVGKAVPAVLPGIGAVVSQAYTNTRLRGPLLRMLESGHSPAAALAELPRLDADPAHRQVGLLAAEGTHAAHTGGDCSDWAGHRSAPGILVLGNLLAGPEVVDGMLASLTASPLVDSLLASGADAAAHDLARRAVSALRAGLAAGGDRRGQQSAALQIATGERDPDWPPALTVDLRVDDHGHPLDELDRMLDLKFRA
ncbi:DUF1028 domain-containing protein [Salinibacterium sp. GXW1014]|uniref:DUF1028 domain-containing protein n=1 Tax=Salinibacterium sp. GXW1014 TaxID=3377838 RepID=UPI00383B158B